MDKVLLIEASGMTFRCDSVSSDVRESTDKTGMMILKGVPATILDRENGNGRRYTRAEMQRAIRKAREAGLFENRRLLCTADDHPEESFPAPINSSHVVIDAYTKTGGDDIVLMNDWLVFNTSKGKDLQGLVEGGARLTLQSGGWVSITRILTKLRIMTSLVVMRSAILPLVHSHPRSNSRLLLNQWNLDKLPAFENS